MADSFRDYLIGARKEAERNLYDIESEIRNLQDRLKKAEEQKMMFQYVISDLTHKLHATQEAKPAELLAASPRHWSILQNSQDARTALNYPRNALAHLRTQDDRKLTIREMVLSVLGVMTDGLEVNELIEFIQTIFGVEVARTSLSPQLSRMKAEGELELVGDTWKVTAPAAEAYTFDWS